MNNAQIFEGLFLLFLFGDFFLKMYLSSRQKRCVLAHRGAVPEAFAAKISLEDHQKAADYTVDRLKLAQWDRLIGLVFLLILTLGGLIEWVYKTVTLEMGSGLWAQVVIILILSFIGAVISFPISWYSTFKLEAKYGFNTTTKARFFKDLALSTILTLAIGIPLLLLIFWLWDITGNYWWLWAWAAYAVFNLLLLWIYPSFIAPLFNKFTRLPEGELASRINALLNRIGFESKGLYVMDASKRNSKGNAYMTGFGRTKRIVFFDTLINKLEPNEVEAVLAHELGHYKLHHIIKTIVFSFAVSLALFWLLDYCSENSWFYNGLGAPLYYGPSHAVALLLFFNVLPVFTFPFSPLSSILSRKHEFEADRFAVENSDGSALISALVKLYKDNASTLTPDSLYSEFYSSHPEASTRIAAIQKELDKRNDGQTKV